MQVAVTPQVLEPWRLVAEHERTQLRPGSFGASAVFVGTMRDFNDEAPVQGMQLEHYPGMTERHLADIAAQALQRWQLLDLLVVHRVGALAPGEPIVVVAAWSAHRAQALAACSFVIEDLKARAPFWKREQRPDGARWVQGNTPAT